MKTVFALVALSLFTLPLAQAADLVVMSCQNKTEDRAIRIIHRASTQQVEIRVENYAQDTLVSSALIDTTKNTILDPKFHYYVDTFADGQTISIQLTDVWDGQDPSSNYLGQFMTIHGFGGFKDTLFLQLFPTATEGTQTALLQCDE